MADKIIKITFRLPEEDHALLTEIKDSGKVKEDSFAPLIRLYVRMGLLLHRHGILTLEELSLKLARLTIEEVHHLETSIIERLTPTLLEVIKQEVSKQTADHN